MAQADDPDSAHKEPRPAVSPSRFWQRYSGRKSGTGAEEAGAGAEEAEAATNDPLDPEAASVDGGDETGAPDAGAADAGAGASGTETGAGHPPPWAGLEGAHSNGQQCLDWCPICRGADLLRTAVPPELQEQFHLVQRDALLMAQAMIQAQLAKLNAQQASRQRSQQRDQPFTDPFDEPPGSGPDEDPGISSIPID